MIGDMIRKLREKKNITQSNLGEILNLSPSTIGMYEQNRRLPDVDTLIKLCKLFSVSCDYLLEITDSSAPYMKSNSSETLQDRIRFLMKYNDIGVSFITGFTKIRKQRLEDILKDKKPDVGELMVLAECFNVSTDYLLRLTDEQPLSFCKKKSGTSFSHRLTILIDGYSEMEVANKLDISIAKLRKLINGDEQPTPTMLCQISKVFKKSTDYLLGLTDNSRDCNINGNYPFQMDNVCIERIQKLLVNDSDELLANELGITQEEYFLLFHYGFIPHLSVLQKLCKLQKISADYLLNFSESPLIILVSKETNEDELIRSHRKLNKHYRKKIDGIISEQIIQQEKDSYMHSSFATEDEMKKTGTNDMGK